MGISTIVTFLTLIILRSFCIPFNKSKYSLNNAEVVERTFKLYYGTINYGGFFDVPFRTGEAFFTKNPGVNKNSNANLSWGELLDQSNLYDRTLDPYSVNIKKGTNHTVYFSATINSITFDCPQAITNGDLVFTLNFKLYRSRASVLTLLATSSHPYYVGATTPNPGSPDKITMGAQSFDIAVNETAYPNDSYIMVFNYTTTGELYTSTIVPMQVSIYSNSVNSYDFYNVVSNSGIVLNTSQTLEINKLIPDKIKIKDFLTSLIKVL
jgi:hypothetical protein